jgi:hypothetical protein
MVENSTTERAEINVGAVFDAGKSVRRLGAGNIATSDETLEETEILIRIVREVSKEMTSALNEIAYTLQILADSAEKSK